MMTPGLILREIAHRKLNFVLSLLAIVTAVALFVAFFMTGEASKRETTRLMRELGFNLRIVPKAMDMGAVLLNDFSEHWMPEDCAERMVEHEDLMFNHLLATLQKKISWRDRTAILTGITEEVAPPGRRKSPMIFSVAPGTVVVGFELARASQITRGDEIDIRGRTFTVAQCRDQRGNDDDVRVYGNLQDVQALLGMEGKINEIRALECLCLTTSQDQKAAIRQQLQEVLPEAKVIKIEAIAQARQKQRLMMERAFGIAMPFVLVVCAAWVGILAMLNVRQRQAEIGLLRALGHGSGKITSLFLGKAVLAGVLGAVVGFAIGTCLALAYGPELFPVTAGKIKPAYDVLGWLLLAAPTFAAVASFIPAMAAVTQDPAVTLREA